ncbi:MAG: hypothetical protein ABII71_04260 [Candidatus Micrarchaeota archaeon]
MKLILEDDYRLYKMERGDFPENTYILSGEDTAHILFRPYLAGKELQDRMEGVAEKMMKAAGKVALNGKKPSEISELVFLAGGLYYQMNQGFKRVFDRALPQCFLGIKRQRVEGTEGGFTAVATYENFESLPDNATVIIGDTIATGATLQKGIYHLFEALQLRKQRISDLIVFSLACSVAGAKKMKEIEDRMKRDFPESKVHFFVCEQLFHLMPDGTDMRFLYDDSVIPDGFRAKVIENFGEELGHDMKCAVFDWGTRCKNPIKHYAEFLEAAEGMLKEAKGEKTKAVLEDMIKETKEALEGFSRPL